jgi:hypothetical protein
VVHHGHLVGQRRSLAEDGVQASNDLFQVDRDRNLATATGSDGLEDVRLLVALARVRLVLGLDVEPGQNQGGHIDLFWRDAVQPLGEQAGEAREGFQRSVSKINCLGDISI